MRNGLKALPIEADIQDEVTVNLLVSWTYHCYLIYVAVCAHVGCSDNSKKLHRDAEHGDSNPPGAFIFWLKPEVLRRDFAPGLFLGQLPRGQQDIPSHETSPAEVPAWDACGFQKLLNGVFPYSRQSLVPQVCDYVWQSFWFGFCNQFRNQKYLRTFEVGSILPDSVLFILFWAFLSFFFFCCPGDWRWWRYWCFLFRWDVRERGFLRCLGSR